jgi:hypothetical protein
LHLCLHFSTVSCLIPSPQSQADPRHVFSADFLELNIQAALKKTSRGQERKAFKILCSNGVADPSPDTTQAVKDAHPPLPAPLQLPTPAHPQLSIYATTVLNLLFKDAADFEASKDAFGWTSSLFFHERGLQGASSTPFPTL